jgi:hypothetical protein
MKFQIMFPELSDGQIKSLEGLLLGIIQAEFVHGESSQAFDDGRKYEQFRIKQALQKLLHGKGNL